MPPHRLHDRRSFAPRRSDDGPRGPRAAEQPGEGLFPQLSDTLLRHEPAAVENGEFEERIAYIDDEIHNSRSVL